MEEIFTFLKGFDLHTIITMVFIGWFFTKDIKKDMDAGFEKIEKSIGEIKERLARIEGVEEVSQQVMLRVIDRKRVESEEKD
jgi:hypothetical protein